MVIVNVDLTCTTTGSASNNIEVSAPITGVVGSGRGGGFFYDSSATDMVLVVPNVATSTAFRFQTNDTTSSTNGLGSSPNVTLGNDDVISFTLVYEAA
jgi:hypothetical protein